MPYLTRRKLITYDEAERTATVTRTGREFLAMSIALDKTPGYPLSTLPHVATNADVFTYHSSLFWSALNARLTSLYRVAFVCDCDEFSCAVCPHIRLGLHFDPTSVFNKSEPTKKAKVAQGRARHIDPNGLLDGSVERLLNADLNTAEIMSREYLKNIPSQPGFDITSKHSCRQLYELVSSFGNTAYSDMQGWDTTVQPFEQWDELMLRARLLKEPLDGGWYRVARMQTIALMRSIYILSNGKLIAPIACGMWSSGRYCTSSGNSHMRFLVSALVQRRCGVPRADVNAITMGDDCVEHCEDLDMAKREYARLGHVVKIIEKSEGKFEFMSHEFTADGPTHVGGAKVILNFLVKGCPHEAYDSHMNSWLPQDVKDTITSLHSRRWRIGDVEDQCAQAGQTSGSYQTRS